MPCCNQCGRQVTAGGLSRHIAAAPGHSIFYERDASLEPHDYADPEYQPANSADYDETWADIDLPSLPSSPHFEERDNMSNNDVPDDIEIPHAGIFSLKLI
jgi:hypothetical protein